MIRVELIRFTSDRMPGLPLPFSFEAAPGLNILTGPNGSGKSSTARALAGLLWPDRESLAGMDVRARFRLSDRELTAAAVASRVTWSEDGRGVQPPQLPSPHLAACYHLDILDLISPDGGRNDRELARLLATALTGGMDPDRLREELFSRLGMAAAKKRKALQAAREKVYGLRLRYQALAERRAKLADLEEQARQAGRARRRIQALDDLRDRRDKQEKLERFRRELAALAPGCEQVRPRDPQALRTLQKELSAQILQLEKLEQEQEDARRRLTGLTPSPDRGTAAALKELDGHLAALDTAQTLVNEARRSLARQEAALHRTIPAADGLPEDQAADVSRLEPEKLGRILESWGQCLEQRVRVRGLRAAGKAGTAMTDGRPSYLLTGVVGGLLGGAVISFWQQTELYLPLGLGGLALILLIFSWWRRRHRIAAPDTGGANELQEAEDRLARAEARLRDELHGTDLHLDPTDTSGPLVLLRVQTYLEHMEQRDRSGDALAAARAQRDRELAACNDLLTGWGCSPAADPAAAHAARTALEESWRDYEACRDRLETMAGEIREGVAARERLQEKIDELLRSLQLDPATAGERDIEDLLADRDAYRDLQQRISTLEDALAELDRNLEAATELFPDVDLHRLSQEELEDLHAREQALADASSDLEQNIGGLRQEIRTAGQSHVLEQALAAENRAEDILQETWQRDLTCSLGELLLEEITTEYRHRIRPRALEEADRILRDITGQAYRLTSRPDTDGTPSFVVHDETSDLDLTPAQLSTGTRTQLFLAVRLGFLTSQTMGEPPPIILDDILTTSDPARFVAAVTSLGRLADTHGLQLFYLCARPDETDAWRQTLADQGLPEPHVIDLAAARKLGAMSPPSVLNAWNPDRAASLLPPPPGDMTPDAYGLLLQPPRPRTADAPGSLHLFFLLADDLPLLHRLLTAGVETVGHWHRSGRELQEAGRVSQAEYRHIETMTRLWERFLELWRTGRPPRVTPEFLQNSPAVTEKMLTAVVDLLEQVGGRGAGLVVALRQKKIARFHQAKIDQLESELQEAGLLDPRPKLETGEITSRLAADQQLRALEVPPDTQTIHLLVDRLAEILAN